MLEYVLDYSIRIINNCAKKHGCVCILTNLIVT